MRRAVQHGKLVELAVSLRVLAGVEQRGVFLDRVGAVLHMLLLRHRQQRERIASVGDAIVLSSTRHTAVVIRRVPDAVKRRLAAQHITLAQGNMRPSCRRIARNSGMRLGIDPIALQTAVVFTGNDPARVFELSVVVRQVHIPRRGIRPLAAHDGPVWTRIRLPAGVAGPVGADVVGPARGSGWGSAWVCACGCGCAWLSARASACVWA